MDTTSRALLSTEGAATLRVCLNHAKQGVVDPRFAKDQCALIVEQLEPLVTFYEAFFTEVEPTADGSPHTARTYRVHVTRATIIWETTEVDIEAEDTEAARVAFIGMDDGDLDYDEVEREVQRYTMEVKEIDEHPDEPAPQWKGTLR